MKPIPIVATIALLAGCATSNNYVWTKPGSSQQSFNEDQGQCRAQAFSIPNVPLMQAVMVFESCLQGKGWYKTAQN